MALLEMRNICKRFNTVIALDKVDFNLDQGEVVSLLGENGAGKTTLMKVLYGMVKPDEGEICFSGNRVTIDKPSAAIKLGIYMVHQHFMLMPAMTVVENIIVGEETGKGILLDKKEALDRVQSLIEEYNFDIDANAKVAGLSVGQCQRVELLKALYREADILILDEPTAVLTPTEVEELFAAVRKLKVAGKSIVIITHKLKETMAIADRVCVLRNGCMVEEDILPEHTCAAELSRLMVGRLVDLEVRHPAQQIGSVVLSANDISINYGQGNCLKHITLNVKAGEILGIAGVEGNGQSLLLRTLTGLESGEFIHIKLDGVEMKCSPKVFLSSGIGHIPEDRTTMGIVGDMSIKDNLILGYHRQKSFSLYGLRRDREIKSNAIQLVGKNAIKTDSIDTPVKSLSGGNQQKVMLARTFSQPLRALIIAQPTRGVDVGAMEYIHNQILSLRDQGVAILLVSADLDEVCTLSDRIAVIYEGEIVRECLPGELSKVELGLYMTGSSGKSAVK